VLWFQLYRLAKNEHARGLNLVRRAESAGAHVLVLTIDVPVRTIRPREAAVGLGAGPFRPSLRMILDMIGSPAWLMALTRHGRPKFANLKAYAGANASGGGHQLHAARAGRRLHLGRDRALPRPLATAPGAQGHPASG
jgi:L-lactate dehydrogenase (cytochrome)